MRETLFLTGTKEGCNEGGCGACTVMLSKYDRDKNQIRHFSVVSCLLPLCYVHGMAVVTVEGIGNTRDALHPVQERIAKAHGIQCGFCTPGFVMSMYTLLRNDPLPKLEDIENAFQGNLCRCTGYRSIIDGYQTFSKEYHATTTKNKESKFTTNACPMGEKCCRNPGTKIEYKLFEKENFSQFDPTQEIIFPPELKSIDILDKDFVIFKGLKMTWYRPVTIQQLINIKSKYSNAIIVAGSTEIGIEMQVHPDKFQHLISVAKIKDMNSIEKTSDGVKFGANVTLTEIEHFLKKETLLEEDSKASVYKAFLEMLHWFSGSQIRNIATVAGNIVTASPISDLNPIWVVAGAR